MVGSCERKGVKTVRCQILTVTNDFTRFIVLHISSNNNQVILKINVPQTLLLKCVTSSLTPTNPGLQS